MMKAIVHNMCRQERRHVRSAAPVPRGGVVVDISCGSVASGTEVRLRGSYLGSAQSSLLATRVSFERGHSRGHASPWRR